MHRAGRLPEAVELLTELERTQQNAHRGPLFWWACRQIFLAMAHHRLGNHRDAKQWLHRAVAVTDRPDSSFSLISSPETVRTASECDRCNAFKGPNLSSIDLQTGEQVNLFDPRSDDWSDHFSISGGMIVGLTPMGRATVRLLNMNAPRRVELRLRWLAEGGSL